MVSRRALLMTGGAAVLILGAAGSCTYHSAQRLDAVREPWREAEEGFGDVRLNALAYAILAPSPHNRQPWLIELIGEDRLTLYCDLDRLLPETDPPNRQITISLGAFLELLRQAAAEQGYIAHVTRFPDGEPYPRLDPRPIAHVRLEASPDVARDPLFAHALQRRTVRTPYDIDRPVEPALLETLTEVSKGEEATGFAVTSAPETVDWFRDVCKRGWAIEMSTPRVHHESTNLTRIGSADIRENPDGISVSGTMIEMMKAAGVLTQEKMSQPGTTAYKETRAFYEKAIDATPTFGWLVTGQNTRADQLDAGARWVRLQQAAAQLGLATQPISQVLEEFPELADCFTEVHERLRIEAPARIQGIFRLGYAPPPDASPRWPLTSRLIS